MPTSSTSQEAGPSRPRSRDVRTPNTSEDASSQDDEVTAETTAKSQVEVDRKDDLSWYINHLDEHVLHTFRHCNGHERHDNSKRSHRISMPGWTADTLSRFFAAVSRHSRLRADLIAMEIDLPESEVMAYLDALDEGVAKSVKRVESGADGMRTKMTWSKRQRIFEAGRSHAAREISEGWIAKEEDLASRVDDLVKQRDRAREELEMAKRRKAERSGIQRELKMTLTDRAERKRVKLEKLEELDRSWARHDWGQSLDSTKLAQLDKLTRPSWSEWYKRRLNGKNTAHPSSAPPSDDESEHGNPGSNPVPHTTSGKLSKHAKIAIDNAALESLVAIEKSARTPEQRAEITKLQNRKRNRDNVRLHKLKQQGLSIADIEAKGGVDSAYLSSIGKSVEDERLAVGCTPSQLQSPQASSPKYRGSPRPDRTWRATTGTTTSEDGAAIEGLRRMGMIDTISKESLDVINFQQLAILSANIETSLQTMQDVNRKMKVFLKSVIMSAILIAETERVQCGDDVELGIDHVRRALGSDSTSRLGLADQISYGDDESTTDELDDDESDKHDLTDEEDFQLDLHLDALDEAMDEDLESRLARSAGLKPRVPQTRSKDVHAAHEAYLVVLAEVGKARRHRHSIQQRSVLFPSTYYRRNLGQRRRRMAHKSAALIEDSDSA